MKWLGVLLILISFYIYFNLFKFLKRRYKIFSKRVIYAYLFILGLGFFLQYCAVPIIEKIPSQLLSVIIDSHLKGLLAGTFAFLEKKKS